MNKQDLSVRLKKYLTSGNVVNALLLGLIILLLVHPPAKALLIRGMMQVGFFQPDLEKGAAPVSVDSNIAFRDSSGRVISLASLKGKVVFINFWATWCPPCLAELPSINILYSRLRDNKNIVFIIADADKDLPKSLSFIAQNKYQLPVYEQTGTIPPNICGNSIPATTIINKQGQMVFHHEGAADYTNIEFVNYLKALAAK